jgi:hypothetical protein
VRSILEGGIRRLQIFVMDADGGNPRRLTHSAFFDTFPTWSPKGMKIAFLREGDPTFHPNSGDGALEVINANGSDERSISPSNTRPTWSPDSAKLAFASYDLWGIFVIYADGGNLTRITRPVGTDVYAVEYDSDPSWCPNGSTLIFSRRLCDIEGGNCGGAVTLLVDDDGSKLRPLTGSPISTLTSQATWSPDGTKIIFFEDNALFVSNADGHSVTRIANPQVHGEAYLTWQPLPLIGCADAISSAGESFAADGGTGRLEVTAASECQWTAISHYSWVGITAEGNSGNASVQYSVTANPSPHARTATIIIAAHAFNITQAGAPIRITGAVVAGKMLVVTGENFDPGAVILLNGKAQKTGNDAHNPTTSLIGKKAGRTIKPGDKLQVRNSDGALSQEFAFTGL